MKSQVKDFAVPPQRLNPGGSHQVLHNEKQ